MSDDIKRQVKALGDIVEALNQASGACSQLIHHFQDMRFSILRDTVDLSKEIVTHAAEQASKRTTIVKAL